MKIDIISKGKAMDLVKKYEISKLDYWLCKTIRSLKGSGIPPEYLLRYSIKKYGVKDNLARYYLDKYYGVPVGKFTWGYNNIFSYIIHSIGAFSSIAYPQLVVPNGHKMEYVTTWNTEIHYQDELPIRHSTKIGNDVWIGGGCIIRNNVTIGDGAVIGAGSIITKDVPPYAVVVGVNKIIKYRFPKEIIDKLMVIQWWNWEDEKIRSCYKLFEDPIAFVDAYYLD